MWSIFVNSIQKLDKNKNSIVSATLQTLSGMLKTWSKLGTHVCRFPPAKLLNIFGLGFMPLSKADNCKNNACKGYSNFYSIKSSTWSCLIGWIWTSQVWWPVTSLDTIFQIWLVMLFVEEKISTWPARKSFFGLIKNKHITRFGA